MPAFDDPGLYGRQWADCYDADEDLPDPATAVGFLADLAGPGPVLELAIGTGRVALPLAARGPRVDGIEASPEMIARLRSKPGGAALHVVTGDLADVAVAGPYRVVFLAYNTLFLLVDERRQADCFANVARVLAPGGVFVVEAYVPDPATFGPNEQPRFRLGGDGTATLRMDRHDRPAQRVVRLGIRLDRRGVRRTTYALRYLWPSQIDDLAARADLRLEARYAGWDRSPFTTASDSHVSVYRR